MKQFKKQYKKLYNIYVKKLKLLQKNSILQSGFNLEYFVTYLQFLRDYHILTEELVVDGVENYKVSVLVTALNEYKLYKTSVNNYFYVSQNGVTKKSDEPTEKIQQRYAKEKQAHWTNFWGILCQNLESWCE